jgi:hypothetical protein
VELIENIDINAGHAIIIIDSKYNAQNNANTIKLRPIVMEVQSKDPGSVVSRLTSDREFVEVMLYKNALV